MRTKNYKTNYLLAMFTAIFLLLGTNPVNAQQQANNDKNIKPLMMGRKVPEDFWTREHLFYINGDTIRKSLKEYEGKPLIFDFWGTFCGSCIRAFPKVNLYQKQFKDRVNIVLVNSVNNFGHSDDYSKIHQKTGEALKENQLKTIYKDDYLIHLFPHYAVPQYIWINSRGVVEGIMSARFLNETQLEIIANYK